MQLPKKGHHLLGMSFLIASTCMGVGMLALPVATAKGGFFATLPLYIIVCPIFDMLLFCKMP